MTLNWSTKAEFVLPSRDLSGYIVVITGSNTGLGLETARVLCKQNALVVFACRDVEKAQQAVASLPSEYQTDVIRLDLASLASVREFSRTFCSRYDKLDILINNAGVMASPYLKTSDGFELQFGVNYLGHFLLTNLLLPRLEAASEGRIVNVSSMGHRLNLLNLEDLNCERYSKSRLYPIYYKWVQYGNSKIAQILHTMELNKRLRARGSKVNVYALHPGMILTNLFQYVSVIYWLMYLLLTFLCKTVEQGAATTIFCAIHPSVKHYSGGFFKDCRTMPPTLPRKAEEKAARLWELSEELVRELVREK